MRSAVYLFLFVLTTGPLWVATGCGGGASNDAGSTGTDDDGSGTDPGLDDTGGSAVDGGSGTGLDTSDGSDTSDTTADPTGTDVVVLSLSEPAGVARDGAHVRWGVPIPSGTVWPDDPLILVDETGDVLPTQSRATSLWDDGSVRWVLLDAVASVGQGETVELVLRIADAPSDLPNPLVVTETDESVTLDTGPLQVEIDGLTGAVLRRAWLDEAMVLDVGEAGDRGPFLRSQGVEYLGANLTADATPNPGDPIDAYRQWGDNNLTRPANRYDPFDLEVVVEEQGPVHAVVRISGTHLAPDGSSNGTFIVRVHATRGSRQLRVDQTLIYTGAEGAGVQSYGFRLPVTGNVDHVEGTPAGSDVTHTAWDAFSVDGQVSAGSALGTASRSDGRVGQAVVLRDMAERFPKAIVLTPESLEVQLYPASASPWDLQRYSYSIDTNNGETGGVEDRGAQGLSTTDTWIWRPSLGTIDQDALADEARAIDAGPLTLRAPAHWVSDARVMGYGDFAFDATASEPHARVDALLHIVADFMRINQRREFGWFGIEDYGDIRGLFDGGNASFTWSEQGRYGWSANSGEPSNQLWVQYLRAPSRATLLDAEALARHTQDQSIVHYGDASSIDATPWNGRNREFAVGSQHRHGRQAWSGYAGFPQYSHIAGVETWYYLSGDERARDALYEASEFIGRYGPNTPSFTGEANGIDVLSRAQAVFHDDASLSAAYGARNDVLLDWLGQEPTYVGEELSGPDSVGDVFNLFVRVAPGLMYHHERTDDARAEASIVELADALAEPSDPFSLTVSGAEGSVYYHMAPLAYAAGLTGPASDHYALAATVLGLNCHHADAPDTAAISEASLDAIPTDWRDWSWSWDEEPLDAESPGILWVHRQILWRNDFMQDYHSYRAFAHLAALAAVVEPGDATCQ